MTSTTNIESLKGEHWSKNFWLDYQKELEFKKHTGKDHNKPIQYVNKVNKKGSKYTLSIIGQDDDNGRAGHEKLAGHETELEQFSHTVTTSHRRKAYELDEETKQESAIEQEKAVKPLLNDFCQEMQRKDIIDSLGMVSNQKTFNTPLNDKRSVEATDVERNTWLTQNEDRALFGNDWGNTVSGDANASMAAVTLAAGKITAKSLLQMKARAVTSRKGLYPTKVSKGREYYCLYLPTPLFDDLSLDETLLKLNTEARPRNIDNHPLFQDGDIIFRGIIIKQIPRIDKIAGVGATGIDLWPAYFCGRQSVAFVQNKLPKMTSREDADYSHIDGRGITECLGINKIQRDDGSTLVDHGVLSGFFATENNL